MNYNIFVFVTRDPCVYNTIITSNTDYKEQFYEPPSEMMDFIYF